MTGLHRHLDRQRATFSALVSQGVYRPGQEPPSALVGFFEETLQSVLGPEPNLATVLDCGCGAGFWLKLLHSKHGGRFKLYGFDVTPDMAALAATTLGGDALIQIGDVLDGTAYQFEDGRQLFHIVYAYDVVQQVPSRQQFHAVEIMLEHVEPGGVLIVFDHDRETRYGHKMALKKLLTRYTFLPLVPRHYCNASYPPLSTFSKQLEKCGLATKIRTARTVEKRALIVTDR
jgi:trans-aconitate methyltransferase